MTGSRLQVPTAQCPIVTLWRTIRKQTVDQKYADRNLDLKEDYNEAAITYYYNPQKKCYCYKFEIQGAVDGKWDDELSIHTFTPIVNVNDVNDIQTASTFGY